MRCRASRCRAADPGDVKTFYTACTTHCCTPTPSTMRTAATSVSTTRFTLWHKGRTQYANFSDWDTYRGLAALQGLLFPKQASDMAQSLVTTPSRAGPFPGGRWRMPRHAEMTGDSVVPLIVNLYMFGARDFDTETALRYMVSACDSGWCRCQRLRGAAGHRRLPAAGLSPSWRHGVHGSVPAPR